MANINTARYSSILGRFLGMGGTEGPASELGAEISPVFVLENDRPEWLYLGNERMMGGLGGIGPGAGQSTVRYRNPVGSGVIAVFTEISYSSLAASICNLQIGGDLADLATPSAPYPTDARLLFTIAGGAVIVSVENAASVGNGIDGAYVAANTQYRFVVTPLILTPGSHFDVSCSAPATIRVASRWRERELTTYER